MRPPMASLPAAWLVFGAAAGAAAAPATYILDQASSTVGFTASGRFYAVPGRFRSVEVFARVDEARLEASTLTVTIALDSVETGIEVRDQVLRSPAYFDAARHPHAVFSVTRIERMDGDDYQADGHLTLRGVRRSVPVSFRVAARDPAAGILAVDGEAVLDRGEFGVDRVPRINPVGPSVRITFGLILRRAAGVQPR